MGTGQLIDFLEAKAWTDSRYAIAYAIMRLAEETGSVASGLRMLGTADAATPMGAIEAHGALLKDELIPSLTNALNSIAEAIEDHG